jgi:hypothetical protein
MSYLSSVTVCWWTLSLSLTRHCGCKFADVVASTELLYYQEKLNRERESPQMTTTCILYCSLAETFVETVSFL